ncbi:MAG: hypothetical protein CTY34_11430 [Methylobacter sp.]|nr:MAG: hypothetical protein CTY34_11430 [Methylobacter sp.]PPD05067.1 MAG: hypothetical protein CTY29_02820 [Methylobacter sp.]PPD22309.1 MAG: hypothetical protein CTY24_06710 [Methylobacter sp.]PPD36114.1 MAG: hypothetical protein CTY18_05505 [Methylomonas sp.]
MKKRYHQFNSKRKIKKLTGIELQLCSELAEKVKYGGNPEHKMNPGDFGLIPPSGPRPGKSLCDSVKVFSKKTALKYLQAGLRKGLVSERCNGDWPKNIWAVTDNGIALEAQLENPETGTYHGYPMPESDPLATEIAKLWKP